jgi:hypothetical protein
VTDDDNMRELRERVARAICDADDETLGYERRWPDPVPTDAEQWTAYLLHADAVLALIAPPVATWDALASLTWTDSDGYVQGLTHDEVHALLASGVIEDRDAVVAQALRKAASILNSRQLYTTNGIAWIPFNSRAGAARELETLAERIENGGEL